jgi:hypothetical protein
MNNAWLAGYFDGEGCIHLQKDVRQNKRAVYMLQVCITQKNPATLYLLEKEFGGQVYQHAKGCYRWRVVSRAALHFLLAIEPYCIIKADQVRLAIEFAKTLRSDNLGSTPMDDETSLRRSEIYSRLRELKTL